MTHEPNVILEATRALPLGFLWKVDPDFGPALTVMVETGRGSPSYPIARMAMEEDAARRVAAILSANPRHIQYVGAKADPGITAMLFALVNRDELLAAGWWEMDLPVTVQGEDEAARAGFFLGIVVRFEADMDPTRTFTEECWHHFNTILSGGAMDMGDKVLEVLTRG